jgi:hypothetical protein
MASDMLFPRVHGNSARVPVLLFVTEQRYADLARGLSFFTNLFITCV